MIISIFLNEDLLVSINLLTFQIIINPEYFAVEQPIVVEVEEEENTNTEDNYIDITDWGDRSPSPRSL